MLNNYIFVAVKNWDEKQSDSECVIIVMHSRRGSWAKKVSKEKTDLVRYLSWESN